MERSCWTRAPMTMSFSLAVDCQLSSESLAQVWLILTQNPDSAGSSLVQMCLFSRNKLFFLFCNIRVNFCVRLNLINITKWTRILQFCGRKIGKYSPSEMKIILTHNQGLFDDVIRIRIDLHTGPVGPDPNCHVIGWRMLSTKNSGEIEWKQWLDSEWQLISLVLWVIAPTTANMEHECLGRGSTPQSSS